MADSRKSKAKNRGILLVYKSLLFCSSVLMFLGCNGRETNQSQVDPAEVRKPSASNSKDDANKAPWKLVGKQLDDREVKSFIASATDQAERISEQDYGEYILLYQDGVEILTHLNGKIRTVFLYSDESVLYKQYIGSMPNSLTWEMSRVEVEKIIGPPAQKFFTRNSRTGNFEIYGEYPELEMSVTYKANSETDMQARMITIGVYGTDHTD